MKLQKAEVKEIQSLIGGALAKAGTLNALTETGSDNPDSVQRRLEEVSGQFERAALELRVLCEKLSPGTGSFFRPPYMKSVEIAGTVEMLEYTWLRIRLNTLLPHCRYQPPSWLSDTIRRLLDAYSNSGCHLPFYRNQTVLVIEEYSDIGGRTIYDQDNKGYKAVSNALKGRLFPDDNQYDLGLVLLSRQSGENMTVITVLELADLPQFLSSYVVGPIRWDASF